MTHFTDHVDKLDTLVQHLEECGLSRDVALAAALHRFPPHFADSSTSIDGEIAALAASGKPSIDPAIATPISAEEKHRAPKALFIEHEVGGVWSRMLAANAGKWSCGAYTQQGSGRLYRTTISGRIIGDNYIGNLRGNENIRFIDSSDKRVLAGKVACISLIPMPDALEWVIEVEHELAVATVSVNEAGRPVVDYPAQRDHAAQAAPLSDHERAQYDTSRSVIRDWERLAGRAAVVMETALGLKHGDHHSILDLAENMAENLKREAGTRAALFSALGREDSTLTTPQLVEALTGERDHYRKATRDRGDQIDTLIDREAKMRAAVLDAIGPVSTGSTLDLVQGLADLYKASKASHRIEVTRADERWAVITTLRDILGGGSVDEIVAAARGVMKTLGEVRAQLKAALPTTDTGRPILELLADLVESSQAIEQQSIAVRATLIEASGSRENTLDTSLELAGELARALAAARNELGDYADLREHNLQLQALVSKVRAAVS